MIKHYDLFAGIGGFSLALDNVFGHGNTKHVFVEREEFCQLVLKKHWPEAEYHSCINEFIADTRRSRQSGSAEVGESINAAQNSFGETGGTNHFHHQTILTGGFPCQPFSQAGRRKGTDDDRYLWPAMFESIRLIRPNWIIAENVAGFVTWNEGLVLETVCADLESEGYEVRPFIIPACAVGAPHRRERVWIVANRNGECERSESKRNRSGEPEIPFGNSNPNVADTSNPGPEILRKQEDKNFQDRGNATDTEGRKRQPRDEAETECGSRESWQFGRGGSWGKNWVEVATALCRMDDGISRRVDRNPRLKALGNAIVPQVAEEILRQIYKSL